MEQTAVEWLEDKIQSDMTFMEVLELFEQAKEMERQQHQETFKQSRLAKIFEKDIPPIWESWEQYYNINFKSE